MIPYWFRMLILTTGAVTTISFVILILLAALEGYLDFKNKPREPMEWCPRGHGHFRKQDCIEWSKGQLICPQCWWETMGKMEAKK